MISHLLGRDSPLMSFRRLAMDRLRFLTSTECRAGSGDGQD
jgi:hypothetical protein